MKLHVNWVQTQSFVSCYYYKNYYYCLYCGQDQNGVANKAGLELLNVVMFTCEEEMKHTEPINAKDVFALTRAAIW